MNVKNITLNCQKPRHFGNSAITESSSGAKKRYKRYSEMDNDTLMLKSTLKAHDDVRQGSKMKLYKAMPQITAGIIGTALAITQPGKLSKKVNSGLGFLVGTALMFGFTNKIENLASKIENFAHNKLNKDSENKDSTTKALIRTGIALAGATAATYATFKYGKNAVDAINKSSSDVANAIKADGAKLIEEINSSKLGEFVQDSVIPFEQKHANKISTIGNIAPFGIILGSAAIQSKLRDGIAEDIEKKAQMNFTKGKLIQQRAREQYDNIDAIEA